MLGTPDQADHLTAALFATEVGSDAVNRAMSSRIRRNLAT